MSRWASLAGVTLVLMLSVVFTALNGGQRVTLRLGIATLYRVPLTVVAFGALILGMVVMLVASIHSDLKVRRILRDRLAQEDRDERARIFIDQNQQDLFESASEGAPASGDARPAQEQIMAPPPGARQSGGATPAEQPDARAEDPVVQREEPRTPVEEQGELLYEARYDTVEPVPEPTPSRPTDDGPAPDQVPPAEGEKPT